MQWASIGMRDHPPVLGFSVYIDLLEKVHGVGFERGHRNSGDGDGRALTARFYKFVPYPERGMR